MKEIGRNREIGTVNSPSISYSELIQPLQRIPLYQKIAKKVAELRLLGMSHKEIAKSLKISERTVIRACGFQRRLINGSGG